MPWIDTGYRGGGGWGQARNTETGATALLHPTQGVVYAPDRTTPLGVIEQPVADIGAMVGQLHQQYDAALRANRVPYLSWNDPRLVSIYQQATGLDRDRAMAAARAASDYFRANGRAMPDNDLALQLSFLGAGRGGGPIRGFQPGAQLGPIRGFQPTNPLPANGGPAGAPAPPAPASGAPVARIGNNGTGYGVYFQGGSPEFYRALHDAGFNPNLGMDPFAQPANGQPAVRLAQAPSGGYGAWLAGAPPDFQRRALDAGWSALAPLQTRDGQAATWRDLPPGDLFGQGYRRDVLKEAA